MHSNDRSSLRKAALVVAGCLAVVAALCLGQLPDPIQQQPNGVPEQQTNQTWSQSTQDVGAQNEQGSKTSSQDIGSTGGGEASGSADLSEQPTSTDAVSLVGEPNDADAQSTGESVELPLSNGDSANVSASAYESASQENETPANEVRADITRKIEAAIPQAKRRYVSREGNYEQGVLLVTAGKGTTAEQLAERISQSGIKSVTSQDVTLVAGDWFEVHLTPTSAMDDAIFDLESKGIAKSAQPNYLYQIADKTSDDLVVDVEETMGVAMPTPTEFTEPTPTMSEEPVEPTLAPSEELAESVPIEAEPQESELINNTIVDPTSDHSAADLVNDPFAKDQWGLNSMDVPDAWTLPALSNTTTKVGVAILDNGFNATHTDLVDNVAFAYDAITPREGVEYVMTSNSYNSSHGTHVAGIVAATSNNQLGVSGVGNNHLRLALFRLYDDTKGSISTEALIRSYEYLISHKDDYNIRVANMSLGAKVSEEAFDDKDDAVLQKVDEAYAEGIVTVGSAGNATPTASVPYWNYPSDYETVVGVINLHNTSRSDPKSVERDSTSNYNLPGKRTKHISAPGSEIYSTVPTNAYEYKTGTSMAAPNVAGIIGLMFTANPTLTVSQAVSELYNTARDIGATGWDEQYGYGEADAAAAVKAVTTAVMDGPEYLAVGSSATYAVNSEHLKNWTFSSSDPSVLEVATDGTATAHASGIANVVATSNDNEGVTVSQEVKVTGPITGDKFVALGGSVELNPNSPTTMAWDWSSSNADVATVTNDGVVYGQGVGHATITATLVADDRVSMSYDVAVYDVVQSDVYLPAGTSTTLDPSEQVVNAQVAGEDNGTRTWSTGDASVATVDQTGKVTAVHGGGTVIACTVTKDDVSTITVWPTYVYGPIVGQDTVIVGQTTKLSIAGWDLLTDELQTGWTWGLGEGSSADVATISDDGTVTAKATGTVTVVVSRGEEPDQACFTHEVEVCRISLDSATISIPQQTYTGEQLTPVPVVKIGTTTLEEGTDYTVQYANTVDAGTHQVTITGEGVYEGQRTADFVIVPKKVAIPTATNRTYNGAAQTGVESGDHYTLSGTYKATNAGTYTATVELRDARNNQWSNGTDANQRITWTIDALSVTSPSVVVTQPGNVTYNGNSQSSKPTVKFDGTTLREGTDYTLGYSNNVNAGTATVTITGKENFTDSRTTNFQIVPLSVSSATISGLDTQTYTGKLLTPKPQVKVAGRTLREGTDYTLSYKNNLSAGTATVTVVGKGNYKDSKSATFRIQNPSATVAYRTHVQDVGWQDWRRNGAMSGTSGRSLRLEGINIKLEGQPYTGGIEYRAHVQDIGWQDWKSDGAMSGTSGSALRIEAIQIRLTGNMAAQYDVWYCVHTQNLGWMGWAKNGERAGTTTYGYRLEGIKILVLPKGSAAPGSVENAYSHRLVGYVSHMQNVGWQSMVADGGVSGTTGRSLRVEAVRMELLQQLYAGSIEYRSHVQNIGWQAGWKSNGQTSGTSGMGLRVEALQVRLTGEMGEHYDVWYRVHVQNLGWMGWTKNGASAGTTGYGYRAEAYQVVLVSKGGKAPGSTDKPFLSR